MIGAVIRWQNGVVTVYDSVGRQIPVYQGRYEDVKEEILRDAQPWTKFYHGDWKRRSRKQVSKEEW